MGGFLKLLEKCGKCVCYLLFCSASLFFFFYLAHAGLWSTGWHERKKPSHVLAGSVQKHVLQEGSGWEGLRAGAELGGRFMPSGQAEWGGEKRHVGFRRVGNALRADKRVTLQPSCVENLLYTIQFFLSF